MKESQDKRGAYRKPGHSVWKRRAKAVNSHQAVSKGSGYLTSYFESTLSYLCASWGLQCMSKGGVCLSKLTLNSASFWRERGNFFPSSMIKDFVASLQANVLTMLYLIKYSCFSTVSSSFFLIQNVQIMSVEKIASMPPFISKLHLGLYLLAWLIAPNI